MQSSQEAKWTTDLRGTSASSSSWTQNIAPKNKPTRMKIAKKKEDKRSITKFFRE